MSSVQTKLHRYPLGVPLDIPEREFARVVDYALRGYSAERIAKITGSNVRHVRIIKADAKK